MCVCLRIVFTPIYHIYLNIRQEFFLLHHMKYGKSHIIITYKVKHFQYSCLKIKECEVWSSNIWMNTVFTECSNGDRQFAYKLTAISEDQKCIFLNTLQHCRTFAHLTHLNLVQASSYKSYCIARGTLSVPLLSTRLSFYQNTWQVHHYLSWWGTHDCLQDGADSIPMALWK